MIFSTWRFMVVLILAMGLTGSVFAQSERLWRKGDENSRKAAAQKLREKSQKTRQEAIEVAKEKGWVIDKTVENNTRMSLVGLKDGLPLYYTTHNHNAAISTNANQLRDLPEYKLNGQGLTVGVWDGGVPFGDHVELQGRVVYSGDTEDDSHPHPTHVAGTICARGVDPFARGMATSVTVVGSDWYDDRAEMLEMAATGPEDFDALPLSNHSYGYVVGWKYMGYMGGKRSWEWMGPDLNVKKSPYFGLYDERDSGLDALTYSTQYYLPVFSSGNDRSDNPLPGDWIFLFGQDGTIYSDIYDPTRHPAGDGQAFMGGYDTIPHGSVAKNALSVGAAKDAVEEENRDPEKAMIVYFSNWGPTDDGRIKPDVVGNGYGVYSCINEQGAYESWSGTSMAAPNVTGSLTLLVEYIRSKMGVFLPAAALKGLTLHTADDLGNPGPDFVYGWGLVNVKKAADLVDLAVADRDSLSPTYVEDALDSAEEVMEISLNVEAGLPLKATLCWTDPAGEVQVREIDNSPRLVNDLDMTLEGGGKNFLPWTLSLENPVANAVPGDNDRDNVEQIVVEAPEGGEYTLRIRLEGDLTGDSQPFALWVSQGEISTDSVALPEISEHVRWEVKVDKDQDGYNRSAYLSYDVLPVNGEGNLTAFEEISYRLKGATEWTLFARTAEHFVLDELFTRQYLPIFGLAHGEYEWKIDAFRRGQTIPDATMGPGDNENLESVLFETDAEDTDEAPLPNLQVYALSGRHVLDDMDNPLTLGAEICNLGQAASAPTQVDFYLATTTTQPLEQPDTLYMGRVSVGGLEENASEWAYWQGIPGSPEEGFQMYYAVVDIDPAQEVAETDESNLYGSTMPIVILYGQGEEYGLWLDQFGLDQGWTTGTHVRLVGDVDLDGKSDVVGFGDKGVMGALSTGDSLETAHLFLKDFCTKTGWTAEKHIRQGADFNGDGVLDVMGCGDKGVFVSTLNPLTFELARPQLMLQDFGARNGWTVEDHDRFFIDLNGDGRADVLGFGDKGIMAALASGEGFTESSLWLAEFGKKQGWNKTDHLRLLADVNGDGLPDAVGFGNQGVTVALSTGVGLEPAALVLNDFGKAQGWDASYIRKMADMNGDGRDDILAMGDDGVWVALSDGSGFAAPEIWTPVYKMTWFPETSSLHLEDLNDDGMADMVAFADHAVVYFESTGSGFEPSKYIFEIYFTVASGWNNTDHVRMFRDMTGDGLLDAVGFGNGGVYVGSFNPDILLPEPTREQTGEIQKSAAIQLR